jgi:ribosomal protein S8
LITLLKKLYNFFHILDVSIKTKQTSFVVRKFTGLDKVLSSLFNFFLIAGYTEIEDGKNVHIFLKYDIDGNPVVREITFLVKGSVRYIVRVSQIIKILKLYPYSTGFVLTKHGILGFQECIENNMGGILLVVIK